MMYGSKFMVIQGAQYVFLGFAGLGFGTKRIKNSATQGN